MTMKTEK